jgi:drug/metabolite transporter (DMT)-like permease
VTTPGKKPTATALMIGLMTIYLVWGSTYLGIRIAVETLPPFLMAGARFLVAGALMAAYLAFTRGFRATPHQWRDNVLIGGFLLLGGNGLVSWAEQKVPSGITTLIISVSPLFIVLLDWLVYAVAKDGKRGNRPNTLTFVGIAVGFAGLILLVGPDVRQAGSAGLDGGSVAALVIACLSWGVGSVYTKYARDPAEPFTASAIQMLSGSGWLLLVSVASREPAHFALAAMSARSFAAWSYLVVVGSLVGFTTFVWLMKHCTPARVSTYAYVNPIVAVFLGWFILHEPVSSRVFVAAAIIIAGVATITVAKNRKPAKSPEPPAALAATAPQPAREIR